MESYILPRYLFEFDCAQRIVYLWRYSMFFNALKAQLPKGIFKSCIIPRPIAWISTVDKLGNFNIAPYSYFNALCDNPPMLMFSTTDLHSEGGAKDTLRNVEETGEFVVNIATYSLASALNLTSADLSKTKSEFEFAKIEYEASTLVKAPRVKESPISLECRYYSSVQLPKNSEEEMNRMVIGSVIGIHVNPDYMTEDSKIDVEKIQPIARLGYNDYVKIEKVFNMIRPKKLG